VTVGDRDWSKPAAMAIPPEKGQFELERGRYGPVCPLTPACYGFSSHDRYNDKLQANWRARCGGPGVSGIFVHSAPWSVGSQGYSTTSHGCLNVSPSNALWFYDNTKRGDIVEIVNTVGSTLPGTDGLGDWNIPWEQWKAGNANI